MCMYECQEVTNTALYNFITSFITECYVVHHISYDTQISIAASKYLNSHDLLPAWPCSSVGRATVI